MNPEEDVHYILDFPSRKNNGQLTKIMEEYNLYKNTFAKNIEFDPRASNLSKYRFMFIPQAIYNFK